jgi:hypothetical protein
LGLEKHHKKSKITCKVINSNLSWKWQYVDLKDIQIKGDSFQLFSLTFGISFDWFSQYFFCYKQRSFLQNAGSFWWQNKLNTKFQTNSTRFCCNFNEFCICLWFCMTAVVYMWFQARLAFGSISLVQGELFNCTLTLI